MSSPSDSDEPEDPPVKDSGNPGTAEAPAEAPADLSRLFEQGPGNADTLKGGGTDDLAEDETILVAVRGMVLFPGVVLPVVAGRQRSIRAIQAAVQNERPLGLLLQREANDEVPEFEDLHPLGTMAEILRYVTAPDGTHHVIVQGQTRFRVKQVVRR